MAYESWKVETKYAGVWTDITSFVDTVRAPIDIVRGRDTWRDDITPSRLSLQLRNADQRFSPGNTTSAYALRSAQEIRVADRWGGVEYPLFHGFAELPSIDEWQKSDAVAPRDQTIAVSAVDKLGRLERSRPFVGVIAEHVLFHGGADLKGYWPLNDPAGSVQAEHAGPAPQAPLVVERQHDQNPDESIGELLTFAGEEGPVGDDGRYVLFNPSMMPPPNDDIAQIRDRLVTYSLSGITMASGLYFAAVAWMKPDPTTTSSNPFELSNVDPFDATITVDTFGGTWRTFVLTDAGSTTVVGPPVKYGTWQLAGMRLNCSTGAIDLWVDNDTASGTLGAASAVAIHKLMVQSHSPNWATGHAQIYLGPTAIDHDTFLDQYRTGLDGHVRQSVHDRIEMILTYAGVDADAMQLDATASTPMQRARLAGRTTAQVLAEAVDTEQGLLFTSARDHGHRHGDVVLHARQRRYNPPLAATVDLSWLEPPLSFRTDPPINDMSVTRVGAGTARAQHAGSVDEFGVYAGSATLDTAVDADPANLAAFTVRQHAAPQQRIPRLVLHLRETTDPIRAATILGRELGDQVALSGLPANAPWDVGRFHIEGIRHSISIAGHRVEWNTGPVVGDIPGVPTPYPLVGAAVVRAETRIPY